VLLLLLVMVVVVVVVVVVAVVVVVVVVVARNISIVISSCSVRGRERSEVMALDGVVHVTRCLRAIPLP